MGLFKRRAKPSADPESGPPSGPVGARAYAIGDVHGRLDLLRDLLEQIDADSRARPVEREFVVFLGDLIDRGPDSRGVLQLLQAIRSNLPNPVFLMGNHEEMVLRVLGEDPERVWDWMSFGGYEFAQSYGVEVGRLATLDSVGAARAIRAAVPADDLVFVEGFVDSFRFGDYLMVHAGIRPGVPLEQQKVADLRWIREEFLDSVVVHPFTVVHGHTISAEPEERANRIGIDTGAYASGVLTALCLEGTSRKYMSAAV